MDFLRAVLLGLVPPADPTDLKLMARWRVNVAVTVGGLLMTVGGIIVLAWGVFPALYPGFALAADVTDIKQQLAQVRIGQVDNEIFEAHNKECEALTAKNRDLAVMYEQRVQEKLSIYYGLVNHNYQIQRCPNAQ